MNPLQDVFISYGRADSKHFAKTLNDRLVALGYTVWFDFEDIPLGVDYQKQIDDGIEKADNFLFLISPHSVNSPYCGLEVELALKRKKRIIPLLHVESIDREIWQQRNPNGTDGQWEEYQAAGKHCCFDNMHPEIGKINWVYFREGLDEFEPAIEGLLGLLEADKAYVHQHTVLLNQALEWERNQKQTRYLLTGEDRQEAEEWLAVRFADKQSPVWPTDLHYEYITESIKNGENLMTQVFLAHAEEDEAMTEKVRRSLMRSGITTWSYRADIEYGDDFEKAIARGVEQADNVLLLMSSHSLKSKYCQQELELALKLNKRLIIMLAGQVEEAEIPVFLRNRQYIDLTDNETEADYLKDEDDLLRVLKQDATYHKEHKVLLTKALKWERQQRNPCILLQGYELQHALAWREVAKAKDSNGPTEIQEEFIEASQGQAAAVAPDVFISYSRADSDFARRLNNALQRQRKRTWFDQESIASGADFQQEIYKGIETSNFFLFVLSPRAVRSQFCADEVEYAAKLNKRVVTVLHRPVNPADLHPELAKVQWIDFTAHEGEFDPNFQELLRTLDTDPEHLRFHTQLLVKAIEWDEKGRREDVLLRGSDLAEAEQWLVKAVEKQPSSTALQGEYVAASRVLMQATQQREGQQKLMRRATLGLSSLLVVSIGASAIAMVKWRDADEAITEAQTRRDIALGRQLTAQASALQKEAKWTESQLLNIEVLKLLQKQHVNHSDAVRALNEQRGISFWHPRFNASETTRTSDDGQYVAMIDKDDIVRIWNVDIKEDVIKLPPTPNGPFSLYRFSPNNRYLGLGSKSNAFLWDLTSKKQIELPGNIESLDFSADELYVRIDSKTEKVLWDITEKKSVELPIDNIESLDFSPNGRYAYIIGKPNQGQAETVLWDLEAREEVDLPVDTIESLEFSADDRYVRIESETDPLLWDFNTQKSVDLPLNNIEQWEFSPDSQSVAMLRTSGTVFLQHLDIQQYKSYDSGGGIFKWIDFSPDSRYLLYGKGSRVRRLNIKTIVPGYADITDLPLVDLPLVDGVEEVMPLPTDQCAHPDNHYVGLHGKGTVKFWDLETNNTTQPLSIGQNRAAGLCFSADGQRVSIMFDNGTVGVWNLETREEIGRSFDGFCQDSRCVGELRFSPGGNAIVTDRHVWDFYQGQTIIRPPKNIKKIQLSPELHYVMVHSETEVSVWNIETQERTRIPIDNAESIKIDDVSFSDEGRYMAINTESKGQLWDVEKQDFVDFPSDDINYLRVSPNGQFVAIETNDGIAVWDLEPLQQKISLPGKKLSKRQATFSPNSRYLTLNQHPKHLNQPPDQLIMRWDIENGEELLIEDIESIQSLSFSRDDHYVSLATNLGVHVLWDTQKQKKVDLPVNEIASLSFSADSDYVFIERQNEEPMKLWNLKTQELVDLPIENVEQILFDVNGHHYMILKSPSNTVLWDFKNDKEYNWTEELSINPTTQFSVSPDGQLLALKNEGAIVTWDIDKKIEIASTLSDRRFGEQGFGFSPDSDFLINHNQNFLHVMLVNPDALIDEACSRLPHNLSQQKWKQYFRDELTKEAEDYQKTCENLRDPDNYETES